MAHLDVFRNPDATTASVIPYVVDVQSELLADLPTHVVIPLAYPEAIETPSSLRYVAVPYGREDLTPGLVKIEFELDDEWSWS